MLAGALVCDDYVFMFDFEAQAVVDRHVNVGDEDEGEPCDEVAAPAGYEELEAGEEEEEGGDVMGEAVLAGEEVKEFPADEGLAVL